MEHTRGSAWLPVGLVVSLALVLTGVGAASAVGPVDVWVLSNTPGFGSANTHYITSLGDFQDQIYAGTAGKLAAPGPTQLWRRDGRYGPWTAVSTDGLGNPNNVGIDDLVEFDGKLYAGLWNDTDGGEIQRSADGSSWIPVVTGGKGNLNNGEVSSLTVFDGKLYAGTLNMTNGAEIWRSSTGDSASWSAVVTGGNGSNANASISSFEVFNSKLYAAVFDWSGGRVWRTKTGTGSAGDWVDVTPSPAGFGQNHGILALGVLGGRLYASTLGDPGAPYSATVWRCSACDGSDWEKVLDGTVLNSQTSGNSGLISLPSLLCPIPGMAQRSADGAAAATDVLYFIVGNSTAGMEVWATSSGSAGSWVPVGFNGFMDSHNTATYSDHSSTVYDDHLFVGTINKTVGAEIWQLLPCGYRTYLPVVLRNP